MKIGDQVRMNEALKAGLAQNGCQEHVDEFGACKGAIIGRSDDHEPVAWDVRWQPSGLKYAYEEKWLEPAD